MFCSYSVFWWSWQILPCCYHLREGDAGMEVILKCIERYCDSIVYPVSMRNLQHFWNSEIYVMRHEPSLHLMYFIHGSGHAHGRCIVDLDS